MVERRAGVERLLRRRDRAAVDLAAATEERSTIAIRLLPLGALNQRIAELTALAEEEGLRVERRCSTRTRRRSRRRLRW